MRVLGERRSVLGASHRDVAMTLQQLIEAAFEGECVPELGELVNDYRTIVPAVFVPSSVEAAKARQLIDDVGRLM